MASKKRETIKFITPRGVAIYPKLHKPDTKFKAEGEYSVKLRLTPDAIPAERVAEIEALRDKFAAEQRAALTANLKSKAKAAKMKVKDTLFTQHTDDEGAETGDIILKAKMVASGVSKETQKPWTRRPNVFDAKGKALKPVPAIFGGSELKLAVEACPYYTPKDNEVGITFYLEGVQVLKLVKGGERDAKSLGFGEEDGYTDDDSDTDGGQFDDSDASAGDGAAGGDDKEDF